MKVKTAKELKRVADEFRVELPVVDRYDEFVSCENGCKGDDTQCNICVYATFYTTDELLEWIGYDATVKNAKTKYIAYIGSINNEYETRADTTSEALALLSIHLIKNGVIK